MDPLDEIRVYVDSRRVDMPLRQAIEAIDDDFIDAGLSCDKNLIDLREACRKLIDALDQYSAKGGAA